MTAFVGRELTPAEKLSHLLYETLLDTDPDYPRARRIAAALAPLRTHEYGVWGDSRAIAQQMVFAVLDGDYDEAESRAANLGVLWPIEDMAERYRGRTRDAEEAARFGWETHRRLVERHLSQARDAWAEPDRPTDDEFAGALRSLKEAEPRIMGAVEYCCLMTHDRAKLADARMRFFYSEESRAGAVEALQAGMAQTHPDADPARLRARAQDVVDTAYRRALQNGL